MVSAAAAIATRLLVLALAPALGACAANDVRRGSYGFGVAALAGAVTVFALGARSAPAARAAQGSEAEPPPAPARVVLIPAVSARGGGGVLQVRL